MLLEDLKNRYLVNCTLHHHNLLNIIIKIIIKGKNSRRRPYFDYISQIIKDIDCRS